MNGVIRVLVVDDHVVVRKGLRVSLATEPNITVVEEARAGLEARGNGAASARGRPDGSSDASSRWVCGDRRHPGLPSNGSCRLSLWLA